jgi:hypothetical protein
MRGSGTEITVATWLIGMLGAIGLHLHRIEQVARGAAGAQRGDVVLERR